MGERTAGVEPTAIGPVLEDLMATIHGRWDADPETSYTVTLLRGPEDKVLKKVCEEACEVALASKDHDHDHIRYEAADLVYHLLVALERQGVTLEELAGELAAR